MKKQRNDREEEDRISELPEPILHHILCYLSQKEAVQTCVLSKSWRHLGPTRPKIEFPKDFFDVRDNGKCLSVLEKTLQRYHDQKLSIKEFIIHGMIQDRKSHSLLQKWVPIVVQNMGAKIFFLSIKIFLVSTSFNFRLPSSVFSKAEFLTELYLVNGRINSLVDEKVLCKHLRKLSLDTVYITDATLEKIISSCPLIEDLCMSWCEGLQTMKLTKAPNLKLFKFRSYFGEGDRLSIEIIDAPSIESIDITHCPSWIPNYFPRLKSLCLESVTLSNELIDKFSTNFPCIEKLSLSFCSHSEQFQLSSRSIKHLTMEVEGPSLKAAIIDAPNILCFEFSCDFLPSISFTTTSTEWKSIVRVIRPYLDFRNGASSWFHRLSEIFKALSTSQISLHIDGIPQMEPYNCGDLFCQTFENLSLEGYSSFSSFVNFLSCMFRNFRPRNIHKIWYAGHHPLITVKELENELIGFLCKMLLLESERSQYFGQLNLEDVIMEASFKNKEEWRGVEGASSLPELIALPSDKLKIRFRLKWRIEKNIIPLNTISRNLIEKDIYLSSVGSGSKRKEAFLSVLDTNLQRYGDQKLSIGDFRLEISEVDSESTPVLEKWVRRVMLNMGLKTFKLSFPTKKLSSASYFHPEINYIPNNVVFKHLQTLHLGYVKIEDETFEKIMSCCPLIEDVNLKECVGLKTIKVTADKRIKRFEFKIFVAYEEDVETCDIKLMMSKQLKASRFCGVVHFGFGSIAINTSCISRFYVCGKCVFLQSHSAPFRITSLVLKTCHFSLAMASKK